MRNKFKERIDNTMQDYLKRMQNYSDLSSWAVWESHREDGSFTEEKDMNENIDFSKYKSELQKSNYILLAMNPGGEFSEEAANNSSRKSNKNDRPWSNFHNQGRSRDYLLAEAIRQTKLSGSYMTDIFPIVGSDSKIVEKFINDKKNIKLAARLIKEFDEEINQLLPNYEEVILFCIGRTTEKWALKFLGKNKLKLDLNKKYDVHYLPHYSRTNTRVSSNPDKKNYYPLVISNKLNEIFK